MPHRQLPAMLRSQYHCFKAATIKNKVGSKDDGQCEKLYFSFSFSSLDHQQLFPSDFSKASQTGEAKRFSLEGKLKIAKFCCVTFTLSTEPQKWAFRGVSSVKATVSRWWAPYIRARRLLLYSIIKAIVLCRSIGRRCHSRILKVSYTPRYTLTLNNWLNVLG